MEGYNALWIPGTDHAAISTEVKVTNQLKEEGIDKAERLLEFGGLGHSAVIHSEDREINLKFSEKMKAGRIIVNSPSTHGAIGDIYNTNMPSLTLGCGSFGGNSTTANVSSVNLINIKRVAKRRVNMKDLIIKKCMSCGAVVKVIEDCNCPCGIECCGEKMIELKRRGIVTRILQKCNILVIIL